MSLIGQDCNPLSLDVSKLLHTIPVGIVLLDNDRRVQFINDELTELTGYALNDLIGLNLFDLTKLLIPKIDYQMICTNWELTKDGCPAPSKQIITHKIGFHVPLHISGYPVYDNSGNISGTLLVCSDLHSQLLQEITQILASSLKLEDVLQNIISVVLDYLGLFSTAVFLLEQDTQELRLISCNVLETDHELLVPMGVGAPGLIAQNRTPVYVSNLGDTAIVREQITDPEARAKFNNKSSIGYPLIFNDELVGVIAFDADCIREFTLKEKRLFENIADLVAPAIYNSLQFSNLERLSITDGLTSLYNHRYFQERLEEELTRAQRRSTNLSLLMIDIDHFKNYNDTFGHLQGNRLLIILAELIRHSVRSFDVVCRFGGEEFVVILPDCSLDEASYIAERLRQACEDHPFQGKERQPGGKVTLSIGVSTYPQAPTSHVLVHVADQALYEAKHRNRNLVVLAQ